MRALSCIVIVAAILISCNEPGADRPGFFVAWQGHYFAVYAFVRGKEGYGAFYWVRWHNGRFCPDTVQPKSALLCWTGWGRLYSASPTLPVPLLVLCNLPRLRAVLRKIEISFGSEIGRKWRSVDTKPFLYTIGFNIDSLNIHCVLNCIQITLI